MSAVSQKPRIAVIGLGSMGFGMAISLKRAGFAVTGCDVSADAMASVVKDAGIVVSVVVNAAQTEGILFGQTGAAETMPKDSVFVSSATMDPDVARRLAQQLEAT